MQWNACLAQKLQHTRQRPHRRHGLCECSPRAALRLRRQNNEVSPLTGKPLAHRILLPNDWMRAAMVEVAQLLHAMCGAGN